MDYIIFPEGRILPNGGGFAYEYHLKDHLGSVRVAFTPTTNGKTVVQENAYYPFGATINDLSWQVSYSNKYGYNGKEKLDYYTGMQQYDYSARFYNPLTARWGVIDPLADKYPHISPYTYCMNNPVNVIDPFGMDTLNVNNLDWQTYDPENDVIALDEIVITPNKPDESEEKKTDFTVTIGGDKQVYEPVSGFFGYMGYHALGIGASYTAEDGTTYRVGTDGRVEGFRLVTGYPPLPNIKAKGVITLTKGGAKIIQNLKDIKDVNIVTAVKQRGGSGQNITKIADWLKGKTVGEVANEAATGNAEAQTAIKILKEAKRLSQKY